MTMNSSTLREHDEQAEASRQPYGVHAVNSVFAQEAKNDMNGATSPAVSQMGTETHPSINRNISAPKS
ncbi:uncharacterized protein RHO25_008604 [Cercospora beticola]|uniref:SMP domain-containing protein n=1 Tax=Cercospora beticola TaxID=122368 RepID=A0ABZ0NX58_CERBT|nr:hypothetical protein RHO25_008604 [Cercospora beticola]